MLKENKIEIVDDTEAFGGEDFPSSDYTHPIVHNITATPLPPVTEQESLADSEIENTIVEFYDANPELKNITIKEDVDAAWIQTFTGKKFYFLNPDTKSICIEDIAHSLSLQCRFTGHSKFHYSIAQHSVLVSYLCDKQDRKHALVHDFSEAYISDISTPLKRLTEMLGYKKVEKVIQNAIYSKFDLSLEEPTSVKQADQLMLAIEAQTLLMPLNPDWKCIDPPPLLIMLMSPIEAEMLLLKRFRELFI